jgi:GTPase SAR1 family protein
METGQFLRKRPLEDISNTKSEWRRYNLLFETNIEKFDDIFEHGVRSDINYYVKRKYKKEGLDDSNTEYYEDKFFDLVMPENGADNVKLSCLHGKVGCGKTSLCRYITEKKIPEEEPGCIGIYLDATGNDSIENFEEWFRQKCLDVLIVKGIVKNKVDFCKKILKKSGISRITNEKALDRYSNLDISDLINYIDSIELIEKVLILIDNIDECPRELITNCKNFALRLKKVCVDKTKKYGIVISLRKQSLKYIDQDNNFAEERLPPVDDIEIIMSKFKKMEEHLMKSRVPYKEIFERYSSGGTYHVPQQIKISITRDRTIDFLKAILEAARKKEDFWKLICALSDGNYKYMTANAYHLMHSCKLQLNPAFIKAFVTNNLEIYGTTIAPESIPIELGLECLLAIHYPFFDHKASTIMNLFNLKNDKMPGAWHNTLTTVRVLCYLNNQHDKTINEIIDYFTNITVSYKEEFIRDAIGRSIDSGLINSDHGIKIMDLDEAQSKVSISRIGKLYIEQLIWHPTYLSFMSDDTPVPKLYYFKIEYKYTRKQNNPTAFTEIIKQYSDDFISFIESEEEHEKTAINNKIIYQGFLSRTSYINPKTGDPMTISEYIKSKKSCKLTAVELNNYI